ncbi:MAG: RidA family protein, partial [Chloroflexota bacterium]
MKKTIIIPPDLAPPRGFNHGILTEGGKLLFLAGQDAGNNKGNIVAKGDLVGQFEKVLSNLRQVVTAAG